MLARTSLRRFGSISASQLRKGNYITLGGKQLHRIEDISTSSKGRAGGVVSAQLRGMTSHSGKTVAQKWRASANVETVEIETEACIITHIDAPNGTIHAEGVYDATWEVALPLAKVLGPADAKRLLPYMKEGMRLVVQVREDTEEPIAVFLPQRVTLAIKSTDPYLKTGQKNPTFKPATLENGRTIKVPPHLSDGELVRVNLPAEEYAGRGSEEDDDDDDDDADNAYP